jgi:endo-1,4-beta-D-glucanase Y
MVKRRIFKAVMIIAIVAQAIFAQTRPFPQADNNKSFGSVIKPSDRTQTQLNDDVKAKYDLYKSDFLKTASGGKYYIRATGNGPGGETAQTISEAHGYGMIIFALMAGYDPNAKTIFDGMNALRKAQKSNIKSTLMSWIVYDVNSDSDSPDDAATDGDLDNAYALLLAYKQWSDLAYLNDAKTLIAAIKSSEMGNGKRTKLGDWQSSGGPSPLRSDHSTRSSDWMPGHFRAFAKATGDNFWTTVADNVYTLLNQCSNSSTGLIPDFATGSPARPDPTGGGTDEPNAQHYYYNACRDPWRLATDYAHHKTSAAKTQIDKISAWLRESTNSTPNNIRDGYYLNGDEFGGSNNMAFIAPFAAGMIANQDNQAFLNSTYRKMAEIKNAKVYETAIQLLCMLLISGNWDAY